MKSELRLVENEQQQVMFGDNWISIDDIINVSQNDFVVALNHNADYKQRIQANVDFLESVWREDGVIYGVTTGYGDSCTQNIPLDLINELPVHLSRFHGCGLGSYFTHNQAKAIAAVRLCSLAKGVSAASYPLMEKMVTLLNHDIAARIPEEGSVGASGDLTPLSYLTAVLIGEREVSYQGEVRKTSEVFNQLNIKPITLKPKEALALMNGTAAMTAIACEAYHRTQYLCQLASRLTAMASIALKGNAFHFNERLFAVKPHPGQIQIAAWIRNDLTVEEMPKNSDRLQDRYSLRCAPHVIGVVQDSLPWFKQLIENEINSANDNPIIDSEEKHILHGGHFYGGHIATAMDTMKTQVANLADLLDRQMALLADPKFNNGLPANLSASTPERASINHGFKAVQIGMSAWTAEALKHTMPASVFSRSTECHNQDKVSMGTIAARDCIRVLELTEQVFAAHILAVTQAISIRLENNELKPNQLTNNISTMLENVLKEFEIVREDRALESDLRHFVKNIRSKKWKLYE